MTLRRASGVRRKLAAYLERVGDLTPATHRADRGLRGYWHTARGVFALAMLDLNAASIEGALPDHPGWWDARALPWVADLEAAVPEIRVEVETYLEARTMPTTAAVNGMDRSHEARNIPVEEGMWRVLILSSFGRTVETNALHFPKTMAALEGVPARANIGFSCTEGGTRIDEHRDPNRGSLRLQVPIIVPGDPGDPGDCRITVDGQEVAWVEGQSVLFDLAALHKTCNESTGYRVLLVMEVLMPLPLPASILNRVTQRCYRYLPSYRGIVDRAEGLPVVPALLDDPVRAEIAPAVAPEHQSERRTLANPVLQAQLEEFGYAVVPVLDEEQMATVRAAYASLGPAPDDPQVAINWSFHSESSEYKHAVKAEMLRLAGPALRDALVDHEPYLTTFITKWPGINGTFAPHQDPSLVDERSYRGVTVWIPLEDTGPAEGGVDNGMLHVVPGSHRFSRSLRVSDVDRYLFADHEEAILTKHGLGVPTRAGEALVFDNRLIHYSLPNQAEDPRVVLSFGVRPSEAECVMLRTREPDLVDVFSIDDDFYIDVLPAAQHLWQPSQPPMVTLRSVPEEWTAQEFDALCESVGLAPRTVAAVMPSDGAGTDPGVFCALCGSSEGLSAADRAGRNNAQLVCPSCRGRVEGEPIALGRTPNP